MCYYCYSTSWIREGDGFLGEFFGVFDMYYLTCKSSYSPLSSSFPFHSPYSLVIDEGKSVSESWRLAPIPSTISTENATYYLEQHYLPDCTLDSGGGQCGVDDGWDCMGIYPGIRTWGTGWWAIGRVEGDWSEIGAKRAGLPIPLKLTDPWKMWRYTVVSPYPNMHTVALEYPWVCEYYIVPLLSLVSEEGEHDSILMILLDVYTYGIVTLT